MGLEDRIKFTASPMQVKFPNGSKIIFKGMDKPAKLKSINNVSVVWIEECSEVKYAGFKELLGRLRHPTLDLHMILSSNPVSKNNWSYKHFFKNIGLNDNELYKNKNIILNNTYYHHSTADDNLFLPKSYVDQLEEMKLYDIDLYRIAREGHYGVNGRRVLPQFEKQPHYAVVKAMNGIKKPMNRTGMDFGFEDSYNAVVRMCIDHEKKILYIYWEYYKNHMTDDKTALELQLLKNNGELIKSDSAEPKTIQYYRQQGFNMRGAKKFPGSRLQYTKKVKRFNKIICSDQCPHTIEELKDLTYAVDKNGEIIEDEFNIDPHTLDLTA